MEVVIALKRDRRDEAPEDWTRIVAETPGVAVMGEPAFGRMMAELSDTGRAALAERLGDVLLIEPLIRHHKTGGEGPAS